jgi:hypothetical protein
MNVSNQIVSSRTSRTAANSQVVEFVPRYQIYSLSVLFKFESLQQLITSLIPHLSPDGIICFMPTGASHADKLLESPQSPLFACARSLLLPSPLLSPSPLRALSLLSLPLPLPLLLVSLLNLIPTPSPEPKALDQ